MFKEYKDGKWLVVELVPGFIEAHSGRQFGSPTILETRVGTETAAGAWHNKEWQCYEISEQSAFAAACFEAGRAYQRSRTLRSHIEAACHDGWEKYHEEQAEQEIQNHIGEGI